MNKLGFWLFAGILLAVLATSCGGEGKEAKKMVIEDLPFNKAESAKEYADLVLKAIKTSREKPLKDEFGPEKAVNIVQLNRIVSMYSSGIGGRKDWDFHDFHELSKSTDQSQGFDYAWLDQKGRLGIQIFIKPAHDGKAYHIESMDFRSRLDVMESVTFPTGESIENYKKINYDWVEKK